MEIISDIEIYLKMIIKTNLFVYNNITDQKLEPHITATSLPNAINAFNDINFQEASNIAWESTRYLLVKNKKLFNIWADYFNKTTELIIHKVKNCSACLMIAQELNVDVETLARSFPFVGAIAEQILFGNDTSKKFFSRQDKFFFEGLWVCGWSGQVNYKNLTYPSGQFIVYKGA